MSSHSRRKCEKNVGYSNVIPLSISDLSLHNLQEAGDLQSSKFHTGCYELEGKISSIQFP